MADNSRATKGGQMIRYRHTVAVATYTRTGTAVAFIISEPSGERAEALLFNGSHPKVVWTISLS